MSSTSTLPSAIQVAKCLVSIAYDEQETLLQKADDDEYKQEVVPAIDHLKLQKLVYFAQALRLAAYDEKLFDEPIQAWPLGPVVKSVYQEFKPNGSDRIPKSQGSYDGIDDDTHEFLRQIWLQFGKFSSIQLVNMTHRHKPWLEAREKRANIDEGVMKTFYKAMLEPTDEPTTVK